MNKTQLLREIRIRAQITNVETEAFFKAFLETVIHELAKNGELGIQGFGKFRRVELQEKKYKLPGSKVEKIIGKRTTVRFSPWADLKNITT